MVRFDHPWVDRANTRSDVARRNLQSHAQIDWINLGLGPRIEGGFALGGQQCGAERATFESSSSANILPTSTTILIFSTCIEESLLVDRILIRILSDAKLQRHHRCLLKVPFFTFRRPVLGDIDADL